MATPGTIDLSDRVDGEDLVVELPDRIAKVMIDTDAITSHGAMHFASVSGIVGNGLDTEHVAAIQMRSYQPAPYDKNETRAAAGIITIRLPNELIPAVSIVGVYGELRTSETTNVSYESIFSAEFALGTEGVNAPSGEYVIEMDAPTGDGALQLHSFTLHADYLGSSENTVVTFVDDDGHTREFDGDILAGTITADDLGLGTIVKIVVASDNVSLASLATIATVEYRADIEMGSSQTLRASFTGTPELPYTDEKTATAENVIVVHETQTGVTVEAVNQVAMPVGAGSEYNVEIFRHWGRGSIYEKEDNTLDQGYKSLGGFTGTLTRPSVSYANNDQRVSIDVELPYTQFDLYYLKLRDELRPYIDAVQLYRMVDGEEVLADTVPGSQWVENSPSGESYWRIGTARANVTHTDPEMFTRYDSVVGVENHPYYKDAWDADVRPAQPVSRVTIYLSFDRVDNSAAPQMAGVHDDVIEYMGRFYASSVDGKQPTVLTATDTFGRTTELERTASASVYSIVEYPFAQLRTGAHDTTSLANKVITMGTEGEYLTSIWNEADQYQHVLYYTGHGPDLHTPDATEYDEWLAMYDPASFHDTLIYEFAYPDSPNDDETYNLQPTQVTIPATSTLRYLSGVTVTDENGEVRELTIDSPLTAEARFDYDTGVDLEPGITDDGDGSFTIALGRNADGSVVYPASVTARFEHIQGFGDDTAEIEGVPADTLGTSLTEVDVRIGGIVNGVRALTGHSSLYRVPDDTGDKVLLSEDTASLTGYSPLLGATLGLGYDSVKVYDYRADGVTPNTTRVAASIQNSAEADIQSFVLELTPDDQFRSQLLEVPANAFRGDWVVDTVEVTHGSDTVTLDLDAFRFDEASESYQFDLTSLFDADGPSILSRCRSRSVVRRHC